MAFFAAALTAAAAAPIPQAQAATLLGVNKLDLAKDYVGAASNGLQTKAFRSVETKLARMALTDASELGFKFVRLSATSYGPNTSADLPFPNRNSLSSWMANPVTFFTIMDQMYDDFDANGIKIVPTFLFNSYQFPAMTGETIADMVKNPHSKSRNLLYRFARQYVNRYQGRSTVLFWEFSNELNYQADIALLEDCRAAVPAQNCSAQGDFTTADLVAFSKDFVAHIKSWDPTHQISSGYTLPRPAASHLIQRPGFSPQGPDWTQDTMAQTKAVLQEINAPFDIISVHIYPGSTMWGNPAGTEYLTLDAVAAVAKQTGQKVYVGEFGDNGVTPFITSFLKHFTTDKIDYASAWVWEFYQVSLTQTLASQNYDLGPGVTDALNSTLSAFATANAGPSALAAGSLTNNTVTLAPRVVQTWPLPCTVLSGQTTLHAVASAKHAITKVVFSINGTVIGTASGAPPYAVSFTPDLNGMQGLAQISVTAYSGLQSTTVQTPYVIGNSAASCSPP